MSPQRKLLASSFTHLRISSIQLSLKLILKQPLQANTPKIVLSVLKQNLSCDAFVQDIAYFMTSLFRQIIGRHLFIIGFAVL